MTKNSNEKTMTKEEIKSRMLDLAEVDGQVVEEKSKLVDNICSSIENDQITSEEIVTTLTSLLNADREMSVEESEFIGILNQEFAVKTDQKGNESDNSMEVEVQLDEEVSEEKEQDSEDSSSGMVREEDIPPSTQELDIDGDAHMWIRNLDLHYGSAKAIYDVSIPFERNSVTALIGPSGCGKSTLLRCLNRMNDLIPSCKIKGIIELDGEKISGNGADLVSIRRRVGMVFQKPNPFPKSIYDNIAYGVRLHYTPTRRELDRIVEKSLARAAIWDEVSDRLHELGTSLSGGQQQRICIARTIAVEPEVILMDEPCSALDPIATAKIEELILELKKHFTVVIVTHSMSQAQRVSDYTGFMYLGRLVEFGKTEKIFTDPDHELTNRYITGRFG